MRNVLLALILLTAAGLLGLYLFAGDVPADTPPTHNNDKEKGDDTNNKPPKIKKSKGKELFNAQKYEEAAPTLVSDADGLPADALDTKFELLDLAAEAYLKSGKTDTAIDIYKRIVRDFPSSDSLPDIHLKIAQLHSDRNERRKTYEFLIKAFPKSMEADKARFDLAEMSIEIGALYEARAALTEVYSSGRFTDEERTDIEDRMIDLNKKLLFGRTKAPDTFVYKVKSGDTLSKIALKTKVDVGIIKAMNKLKTDNIYIDQLLKLSQGTWSIRIDKSRFILLVMYEGSAVLRYSIAIGADDQTPTGEFKIQTKIKNPTFYKTLENGLKKSIPHGDPENVLGSRWMGFAGDWSSYGIHGTTDEASIGSATSKGCVRMHNKEIENLFEWVPRGMIVTIQD